MKYHFGVQSGSTYYQQVIDRPCISLAVQYAIDFATEWYQPNEWKISSLSGEVLVEGHGSIVTEG